MNNCQSAVKGGYLCGRLAVATYRRIGTRDKRKRYICEDCLRHFLTRLSPTDKIEVKRLIEENVT